MRLASFTVRAYRSITEAYKVPLGDYSLLVGPNNEGKSNILHAMVLGLRTLTGQREPLGIRRVRSPLRRARDRGYVWERDYPISLQSSRPDGASQVTFELTLTEEERETFRTAVGSQIGERLKLKVSFGPNGRSIDVVTQGPAKKKLNARRTKIAEFVATRLSIEYIPAIRSADMAEAVIDDLLATELAELERDEEYNNALSKLAEYQRPILDRISTDLTATIRSFVPDVQHVRVTSEGWLRHAVRGSGRVLINDGAETELAYKGDGVKSLTAISLVRYAARSALRGRNLVLAVEEPEAHLHPDAIHSLKAVLSETASEYQVLVTTHSPILVDRVRPGSNIIVSRGKAKAAKSIVDVRNSLGVRLGDNLASAYLVLLAEGESDVRVLTGLLRHMSPVLRSAFQKGVLAIEGLGGASALRARLSHYRASLCNAHAFVDHDNEGRSAAERAISDGVAQRTEIQFATVAGMSDSELEDLIEPACYKTALEHAYGLQISNSVLKSRKFKWIKRMERAFVDQAQTWNEGIERALKTLVADRVTTQPAKAIWEDRRGTLSALVRSLEERIRFAT